MQVSDLYVVTKSIGHPGAADGQHGGKVVTIPEYYSMWRCRCVAAAEDLRQQGASVVDVERLRGTSGRWAGAGLGALSLLR